MSETLIKVEGLSKKFCRSLKKSLWYGMQDLGNEIIGRQHGGNGELRPDEFWAVNNVSFELKRGECLGLIGHNGAGKTTLLRMLNGLIKPDQGQIEMRGRVAALIALGAGFNPILTGRENIYVNASVLGLKKHEIEEKIDEIIDFADIGNFIDTPVQNYSSGMTVRLGFAVATALKPDVLLLDEVLAVGDAAFRVKCFNRIQGIIQNCAVIFVSHNMPQVTRICNRLLLQNKGRVLAEGSDIGGIVSQYHGMIAGGDEKIKQGRGGANIKTVSIQDGVGNVCETLESHSPFAITINFELSALEKKNNPKFLITISDQEDCNVAQIFEPLVPNSKSSDSVNCLMFESLPLNAGRYWFTVNILLGERGALACVIRRATSVTVKNDFVGFAPLLLKCSHIVH